MKKSLRIGLFGGSFDPVHNGHIALAKAALKELKLDKVIFIPAKRPPHKLQKQLSSAAIRFRMLSEALKPFKCFEISRYELNRKPATYTFQTAGHFKKLFPGAKLYFLIGSDSLVELKTWKNIDSLINEIEFVSARRSGVKLPPKTPLATAVKTLKSAIPGVSSSQIRALAAAEKSISGLVPGNVEKMIAKTGVYK